MFSFKVKRNLILLVSFAFLVRVVGIAYGLPLWLVGDEPALIFGALKMLELKTLIPSLHAADFGSNFYYGPFLPYVYLPFFLLVAGIKFVALHISFENFKLVLGADPSIFFLVARTISVVFGTLSVAFVYRAAHDMFKNEKIALGSGLALSLSFLMVELSHWARHWSAIVCLLSFVIWVLSVESWSFRKKCTIFVLTTIVSIGISVQGAFIGIYALIWSLLYERANLKSALTESWLGRLVVVGIGILIMEYALWPRSFDFVTSLLSDKTTTNVVAANALQALWFHVFNLLTSETFLLAGAIIGGVVLFNKERKFLTLGVIFSVFSIVLINKSVGIVDRFSALIFPVLAIFCGVGYEWLSTHLRNAKVGWAIWSLPWVLMAIPVLKFDYLLFKNDTRVQALNWAQNSVASNQSFFVNVPLLRIPTTKNAIEIAQMIDPSALRSVDRFEAEVPNEYYTKKFDNVLNAYTITSDIGRVNLEDYLSAKKFNYHVFSATTTKSFALVNQDGSADVIAFHGVENVSFTEGHQDFPDGYGRGTLDLLTRKNLGPTVYIRKNP